MTFQTSSKDAQILTELEALIIDIGVKKNCFDVALLRQNNGSG
ncbi:MAG: hypothetical protein V7K15_18205 [Nostoc sp.]